MVKAKHKSTIAGLMAAGRNAYLFSLGAVATCEEQTRELFDRMVQKGETFEKSDENVLGQAAGKLQDTVSWTLNRAGLPSRDEIGTLIRRVEDLTTKVDQLRATH